LLINIVNLPFELVTVREIKVLGIGLGDPIESFPIQYVDTADPEVSYARRYQGDSIFRINTDETETEIPIATGMDEVRMYGGWLRSKGLAWHFADGKIDKFFIRAPHLDTLEVENLEDVLKKFGEPERRKMGRTGVELHYLSKRLKVAWSSKSKSIEHIGVGNFAVTPQTQIEDAAKGIFHVGGLRSVSISALDQFKVYRGLITGIPSAEMNDRILAGIVSRVKNRFPEYSAPYLIDPIRTSIETAHTDRFRKGESLPKYACVAQIDSIEPAKNEKSDGSGLVLIWFQEALAMPIAPPIQEEIERMDWEDHAIDYFY